MSKKNICIFCMMVVMSLLFGCTTDRRGVESHKDYVLADEQLEEKKENLNVSIKYPQIENAEEESAIQINEIIKEAAISRYDEKWVLEGLNLEQTYKVERQEDGLLSIVFSGYVYVADTAYPTDTCHAVTINLATAEVVALSYFMKSYDELEEKILNNEYEILYGGLQIYTNEELAALIHTYGEGNKAEDNKNQFYRTANGKICIILSLPHAGGDYSIISIEQ